MLPPIASPFETLETGYAWPAMVIIDLGGSGRVEEPIMRPLGPSEMRVPATVIAGASGLKVVPAIVR